MQQEVRFKLDISISLSAEHSTEQVAALIEKEARKLFPTKGKAVHSMAFAEERDIYHTSHIRWTHLVKPESWRKVQGNQTKGA